MTDTITVIDVMRAKRVEITSDLSWSVGAEARDAWIRQTGQEPEKVLTPKTNGPGTHCIARYPLSFWREIERIVDQHQTEADRQMDLFDGL